MDIKELREIGKKLYIYFQKIRLKPFESQSLGKGASGDKTFPIDKDAEDIIISHLENLKIPLQIISEERGAKEISNKGIYIVIDPVDGSKNAINGIPFYCTSIAIAEDKKIGSICLGYIINLLTGDEFWAERGKGAFFNNERIYSQKDITLYLTAYEAQIPKRDLPKILKLLSESRRTRCLGATALDLAYVAYGSVSVFVSPSPSRTFDFAAGWLLVQESEGIITDLQGNEIINLEIGIKKSVPILASGNKELHEKALNLLR
ncbi:MAG: hypothetical protein N3A59_05235 [Thermodesulfovibrionales bacterium]|nr:hypothetical protein [Thermodesulfovibrionales bacterium]